MSSMYPSGLAALLDSLDLTADTINMQLLEGYTYDASDDNLDDVPAGRIGSPVSLTGKTVVAGQFKATVPTFASVTTGHTVDGILVYEDSGSEATSRLICFIDTRASGTTPLAIVTDGTDVDLSWGTNPIFTI